MRAALGGQPEKTLARNLEHSLSLALCSVYFMNGDWFIRHSKGGKSASCISNNTDTHTHHLVTLYAALLSQSQPTYNVPY
jgi:hypothetical protein